MLLNLKTFNCFSSSDSSETSQPVNPGSRELSLTSNWSAQGSRGSTANIIHNFGGTSSSTSQTGGVSFVSNESMPQGFPSKLQGTSIPGVACVHCAHARRNRASAPGPIPCCRHPLGWVLAPSSHSTSSLLRCALSKTGGPHKVQCQVISLLVRQGAVLPLYLSQGKLQPQILSASEVWELPQEKKEPPIGMMNAFILCADSSSIEGAVRLGCQDEARRRDVQTSLLLSNVMVETS